MALFWAMESVYPSFTTRRAGVPRGAALPGYIRGELVTPPGGPGPEGDVFLQQKHVVSRTYYMSAVRVSDASVG
jgi:hypothetical protein